MINPISPRVIHFRDEEGSVRDIKITMKPLPDMMMSFPDVPDLEILHAEVNVESDVLNHLMKAEAIDEMQLIYRLLWAADVYIQTRFSQMGFEVFKIRPGDVDGPMDIYN